VAKRLGYLLETVPGDYSSLINELQPRISKGYALLDPSAPPKGTFVARWNIRVNVENLHDPLDVLSAPLLKIKKGERRSKSALHL
jgi:predicted transcriptional regulator of viral defense system